MLPILGALLLSSALVQEGIIPLQPRTPLPRPIPGAPVAGVNQNTVPAGTRTGKTLTLALDIVEAGLQAEGPHDPVIRIFAFAEAGKAPTVPGPLLRGEIGTTVRLSVHNRTDSTLVFGGLRRAIPVARDTITLAPGATREVTFTLDRIGNWFYWAAPTGSTSMFDGRWLTSQLAGALIVDPVSEGGGRTERIWVITEWFKREIARGQFEAVLTFNGKAWPYNERLTFSQGDSVRFRIVNASEVEHPLHLHGFYFRIARHGGERVDTVVAPGRQPLQNMHLLPIGASADLSFHLATPGNWVFHCHFASHIGEEVSLHGAPDAHYQPGDHPKPDHDLPGGHTMRGLVIGMHVTPAPGYAEPMESDRRVIDLLLQRRENHFPGGLTDGQFNYYGKVTIRGGNSLSGRTTKVLIDGVEVADDELQITDVDPASIERIEIFRGPQASTVYGSAASGGLIQIITKKGEYTNRKKPGVEAKLSAGYNQTRSKYGSGAGMTDNTLTLVGGGKEFSYRIGGGFSKQGNWIKNGFETSPSLFGHLRTTQGPLLLEANVRYLTRNFGWLYNPEFEVVAPSSFGGLNTTKELTVSRSQSYNLRALYQATPHWTHDLTLGFEQTGFDYWSTVPKDALGTQYISINTWAQPSAKYRMGFDRSLSAGVSSSLILGADYSSRTLRFFSWEGVGDPNAGSIPRGGDVFVQSRYLHSSAFYAQEVLGVADKLYFTFGLRADRQLTTSIPLDYAWSPRTGVAYTRTVGQVTTKVRASYGTVPSSIPSNFLQEFVFRKQIFHGNPNLRPPRLRGADVGLELYFGRRASFVATYYNQRPKDLIDFVVTYPDSAGFRVGTYQNVGEIHNRGWEFEGRLFLGRLTLLGTYSPLRGTITKLSPDYKGDLVIGDRLLNVADWTASITASVTLPRTVILLTATPTGRHLNYDFTKLYAAEEDGTYDGERRRQLYVIDYPGFTKFSLSVTQEVSRRYQAFLSVQDLFNTGTIETSDETIPKSRVTRVGLRIKR